MRLTLDPKLSTKVFKSIEPGQFVHLKLNNELLLRRPFSIYDTLSCNKIEITYQVVGKGTEFMRRLNTGGKLDFFGPLGKGFIIAPNIEHAILVGGGIGIAGLHLLLKQLVYNMCNDITVFIGARTKNRLYCLPEFGKLAKNILITTEDGSVGTKGLVTSLLNDYICKKRIASSTKDLKEWASKTTLYSCGPVPMIKSVCEIAIHHRLPTQVSLEARMGCGIGLCRGCVCKSGKNPDSWRWVTVCNEGPVFDASQIHEY
ncbi:MAG: dihydroorotate dehydrogenase electron transfer subunit [Planctomycetota bacterium]